MTIKQLTTELCKREGLKSQTAIGNVREIVGHLSDMVYHDWNQEAPMEWVTFDCLRDNGEKRAKKKPKSK